MMKCSNIADYGLLSCDFTLFRPTHSVTLQACAFRLISMQDKLKKRTTFFFWIVNPHRTTEPWWTTSKRNFTYPTYVSLREFLSRFWVIARLLMMSLFTAFFFFLVDHERTQNMLCLIGRSNEEVGSREMVWNYTDLMKKVANIWK